VLVRYLSRSSNSSEFPVFKYLSMLTSFDINKGKETRNSSSFMDIKSLLSSDSENQHDIYSFFSQTSCSQSPQKLSKQHKRVKVSNEAWSSITEEVVDSIPCGVNGDHIFRLCLPENNFNDGRIKKDIKALLSDGRLWDTPYNCPMIGFEGSKRRQTKCLGGGLCQNRDCPYFKDYGKPNTIYFKIEKRRKSSDIVRYCQKCYKRALSVKCPNVRKIFEWMNDVDLRVKYTGKHHQYCSVNPVKLPLEYISDFQSDEESSRNLTSLEENSSKRKFHNLSKVDAL